METKANFIWVGIFTIISIILGFVFISWVNSFGNGNAKHLLDIQINGSVSGLAAGSEVQFNGINVGRVKSVALDKQHPNRVLVRVMLTQDVPVKQDTFASIGTLGLTGRAYIRLEGGTPEKPTILSAEKVPVLEGSAATIDNVMARLSSVANRADNIIEDLETLVAVNTPVITDTLSNIQTFSQALADNSDTLDDLLGGIGDIATSIAKLSDNLEGTIVQVEKIVEAVDPQVVAASVKDLSGALKATREFIETIEAQELNSLISELRDTTNAIGDTFNNVNAEQIEQILQSLSQTAQMAEKVSTTIAARSDEIDSFIVDADGFIADMRGTATKLNVFLEQMGETVGGENSQNVLYGAQRALERFEKVLLKIEQNPESLLFGATPAIPETAE